VVQLPTSSVNFSKMGLLIQTKAPESNDVEVVMGVQQGRKDYNNIPEVKEKPLASSTSTKG